MLAENHFFGVRRIPTLMPQAKTGLLLTQSNPIWKYPHFSLHPEILEKSSKSP